MLIIAHRGASGYAPENTMAAFKLAIEQGADGIELDVRLTKDGIPVVIHDGSINRTGDGKGYVHELTLAEMQAYDFGSWYSPKFKNEQIPTLEEVLKLLQDSEIMLNIEIKKGPDMIKNIEEEILQLIYKYKFADKVLVSSFDHIVLQRLSNLDSTIKIGFITNTNVINVYSFIESNSINPYSIHPDFLHLSEELIKEIHLKGMKVYPYTINSLAEGEKFEKMMADGIITDMPSIFK
ncbi:glycerophosphodiester phosphodiesterase [Bacillus sp. FSL K6-3431]|uniref:glycerophosphodiester phosphodiesterase n=1 Tax=Bacillus sp. FSL K6-3431 TaxID=2921500 RepID=UPI0030F63FD1